MELFIAAKCDIDADIDRALTYDKGSEAARLSQDLDSATRIIESWVLRAHGRMLSQEGASWSAQIPAERLEELPDITEQYENACSARLAIGVGAQPSEAVIARKIAEERGGNPAIILYTPDLSEEARKLDEMSDDEANELDGASPDEDDGVTGGADAGGALGKAEGAQREPGEATQVVQGQLSPTAAAPSPPPSASISAGSPSPQGQQPPGQAAPQGEPSEDEVLQAVGQVLTQFKQQLPFFEQQVKQANPQAYQAVMGMIQGMIAMANKLASGSGEGSPPPGAKGEQEVKKSEGYQATVDTTPREELNPQSWHIRYRHEPIPGASPEAMSYVNRKGNYTATPNAFTQYDSREAALENLRRAAMRSSRPETAYSVEQGVGPVFKGEVDPETGESSKVELEPNKPLLSVDTLRKLYDTVGDSSMKMGEASPTNAHFNEFVVGFEHEAKEHPHLDANQAALTAKQHLAEDPQYYSKLKTLEETKVLGEGSEPMTKAAVPASRHHVILPPGSVGVGSRARSVKVVEPVSGKTSWHQVSTGQKLSGDGHTLSTRVAECPSADTPEKRAADAGLVGAPTTAQEEPPQTAQLPGK